MKMFLYNQIDHLSPDNFERALSAGKKLTGNENWFEDLRKIRIIEETPISEAEAAERAEARAYWWPNSMPAKREGSSNA